MKKYVILGVLLALFFYAKNSTVYATSSEVCFCHNINNNPITICTSNQGQINGHLTHVNNGEDVAGKCALQTASPTGTPNESPIPTPTSQATSTPNGSPTIEPTATAQPTRSAIPTTAPTQQTTGSNQSDGRTESLGCLKPSDNCNTQQPIKPAILGATLPVTGSDTAAVVIFLAVVIAGVGIIIKHYAQLEQNYLDELSDEEKNNL